MNNLNFYKKIALAACVMILSFSSCNPIWDMDGDSDFNQSIKFAGQWTGDFGMYYNYEYRGRVYTFDSYDTDIVFYPEYDGATYGYGKQVDYYEYGPYSHVYNRFDWEILRNVIYLTYYSDPGLDCAIYDYYMSRDMFTGRFGNSNDKFRMYKIADYYDWSIYTDYYYYYNNNGWSWAPYYSGKEADTAVADSVETGASQAKATSGNGGIVSFGRRF